MTSPEELRRATENMLHGLTADETLKFRILQAAARQSDLQAKTSLRLIPVLCTVLAALLVAVLALNTLPPVPSPAPGEMKVFAAGKTDTAEKAPIPSGFDSDIVSLDLTGFTIITDPVRCAALVSLLQNDAEHNVTSDFSATGKLIIQSADGSEYVFSTDDPFLIGDDNQCWYCPSFFNEIKKLTEYPD